MIQLGSLTLDLNDPVVQALIGAVVVALIFAGLWLSARKRAAELDADLAEAEPYREEAQNLREALAASEAAAERLHEVEATLERTRNALNDEYRARVAKSEAYESLQREHAARLEELRGMKKEIEDRFSSVASGVLQKNSEAFLALVSERFKTHEKTAKEELDRRRDAIEHLVKPLNTRLNEFGEQIQSIEKARNEAYGAIHAQVKTLAQGQAHLGQETRKLVQALRAPKTRGRWGEMQLRQVFEMAGMSENVDFHLEQHFQTDAGARRPDAIVHIPGGKSIVIDAKTPLEAYLDALEAETPELQNAAITRHAQQVRQHVKLLSSKSYQDQLHETPDFVVMFIPGETFVAAAAEADPGLIEYAFENKVLIASPTTLMALVKAIAYGWQQEKMARNAIEVQKTAKDLYERIKTFGGHVESVGKALTRSVESYNKAVGSLESRVLPSARRFEQMGVVPDGGTLETPALVDSHPRAVSAPALVQEED
ncbi:recombinase RmuC [Thioclava sp. F34-6]|uniref:DNA recombination protein RmuC n=1 Tax=Thioclava sp. F34-6 TaxID=1973003 RepID=UPI000B549321|nr:DNA recombination protein RmuC [Thioclava sp. F34-6]OWY11546.1 recombinase RmuC [Thioclava sp. F34-6]